MRFIRFLNEDYTIDNVIKDCQYYIENFLNDDIRFARLEGSPKGSLKKFQLKERYPTGTHSGLFPFINKGLKNNGFIPRDKCLIVTNENTHRFKNTDFFAVYAFPVGKFNYNFCKSEDFNLNKKSDPFQLNYFKGLSISKNPKSNNTAARIFVNDFPSKYVSSDGTSLDINSIPDNFEVQIFNDLLQKFEFMKKEKLDKGVKNLKNTIVSNRDIKKAYSKGYEIGIDPKEFYLLNKTELNEVLSSL